MIARFVNVAVHQAVHHVAQARQGRGSFIGAESDLQEVRAAAGAAVRSKVYHHPPLWSQELAIRTVLHDGDGNAGVQALSAGGTDQDLEVRV